MPFPAPVPASTSEAINASSTSASSQSSADPFQATKSTPSSDEAFDASDPFAGSWSEVARSIREPTDFESLPVNELTKELAKLRTMRVDALQTHLVVLKSQLESNAHDRLDLLERYALTAIELSQTELEQATSSAIKQASMRRAITALRNWEGACLDRDTSSKQDASKSLAAVCLRLKWEERLVQELLQQKTKPLSKPTAQSSSSATAPPRTIVVEPASGYYYPTQPVYQYPRTYRSR